ncbi:MAG TPA: hypothetical protein VK743_16390 [Steroidobacteraceae bacterium]|jgi:hypothetical protein|nr:hypothetical protein [Steroidobacteraceae bacterium]
MNRRFTLALAGSVSLGFAFGQITRASEPPARHSLESDYGFMIGRWTCHVTQAGTPDREISVEYEWAYDRRVLRESMRLGDKLIGEFFTTYDKAKDGFKGVGVGAWGSYVVWENRGFHAAHLSEKGFTFDGGQMTPVSRSEFERVSDTHYVVRDFDAGTGSSAGPATDTEDCNKVK